MRETALHSWLEWKRAAVHVPGAIRKLGCEQIAQSAIDGLIGFAQSCTRSKGIDRLAGRVSIALQTGQLRPASVGPLFGEQRISQRLEFGCRFACPCEAKDLVNSAVGLFW